MPGETIDYGRAFFERSNRTGDLPADWVSKIVNESTQVAGPLTGFESELAGVDVKREFPAGERLFERVNAILDDTVASRQNYLRFVTQLRQNPNLLQERIQSGVVDIDIVASDLAAIRQHLQDVGQVDVVKMIADLQKTLVEEEPALKPKPTVADSQDYINALMSAMPQRGEGDSPGMSLVDPLFKIEQLNVVFERVFLGLAGMDRQSHEYAMRSEMLRHQVVWFLSFAPISEYLQSLTTEGNNAFETPTAALNMISAIFKLKKASASFAAINKGNSQEMSALAAELPTSPELEALLNCYYYKLRIIDLDGRERVIKDGVQERLDYLHGVVDPQKLGLLEYVEGSEGQKTLDEALGLFGADIVKDFGRDFKSGEVLKKWNELLNSGVEVDFENINRTNPLFKKWKDEELRFAREILMVELWVDDGRAYTSAAGGNVEKGSLIIPKYLDSAGQENLEKYGRMAYFDFGNPFVGALQPATEHFTRPLSDFDDDGVGEYFNYLMRKHGIDPNRIDVIDLPRFPGGTEWNRTIMVRGRRGALNYYEIGLLGGGGISKAGGHGGEQEPFAYLYEEVKDANGIPLRDPDTGMKILAAERDNDGNEILRTSALKDKLGNVVRDENGEVVEELIPRQFANGKTIKDAKGNILYEPALNKYNQPRYQKILDSDGKTPLTVSKRDVLVKDILAARHGMISAAVTGLWQGMLLQDADPYDDSQVLSKALLRSQNWEGYSNEFAMELPYLSFLVEGHMTSLADRKDRLSLLMAATKPNPDLAVRIHNPLRLPGRDRKLEGYEYGANAREQVQAIEWLLTADRRVSGLRERDDINLNKLVVVAERAGSGDTPMTKEQIVALLMPEAERMAKEDERLWKRVKAEYGTEGRMRSVREVVAELEGRPEYYAGKLKGLKVGRTIDSIGIDTSRYPDFMLNGRLGFMTLASKNRVFGWHNFGNIRTMMPDILGYAGRHGDVAQEVIPELIEAQVVANSYGLHDVYAKRFGAGPPIHDVDINEMITELRAALYRRPSDKEKGEQVGAQRKAAQAMKAKWSHLPAATREMEIASIFGRLNQMLFGRVPECVYVLERDGMELPVRSLAIKLGEADVAGINTFTVVHLATEKEEAKLLNELRQHYKYVDPRPIVNTGVNGDKKVPLSIDITKPWGQAVDEVVRAVGLARTVKNAAGSVKLSTRSGQMVFRIHTLDDGTPMLPLDEKGTPLLVQPFLRAFGSDAPMLASDKQGGEFGEAIKNWWAWMRRNLADTKAVSTDYMDVFDSFMPEIKHH